MLDHHVRQEGIGGGRGKRFFSPHPLPYPSPCLSFTPLVEIYFSLQSEMAATPDLPTPATCKSGGFEKQAQKNLEIRASNLETLKMCIK